MTQLHDKNKTISSEALDILDEACEDKVKLSCIVVIMKHLGRSLLKYSILIGNITKAQYGKVFCNRKYAVLA